MKGLRVFIGCIPGNSDTQELVNLLGQFARIQGVMLATDKNSAGSEYCLGYGFAVCESKIDVEALLAKSNMLTYRGRYITLREYKVGGKLKEDKKKFNRRRLFLGNVPQATTNDEIIQIFSKFGSIENVYFVNQEKEQSYKYGYIVFHDEQSAEKAICDTQGVQIGTFKLRVELFGGKRANPIHNGSSPKSKGSLNNISSQKEKNPTSWRSFNIHEAANINSVNSNSNLIFVPEIFSLNRTPSYEGGISTNLKEPVGLVEGTTAWRKAIFHRHKTCSLEYQLQFPSSVQNHGDQQLSHLEQKNESNKLSTMMSGQANLNWVKPNIKHKGGFSHECLCCNSLIGHRFLSPEQNDQMASNHGNTNIRFNRPSIYMHRVQRQ